MPISDFSGDENASAPLASAVPGDKFIYDHPADAGYGEHALGQPLSAEMMELDLKEGKEVTFLEYDAETGWPLVEWVDDKGLGRITTIDPQYLALFPAAP
jgi:hypothetical protein